MAVGKSKESVDEAEQTPNGQLRLNIMKLKSDPAYLFVTDYIRKWQAQVLGEILGKDSAPSEKGEYKAYGRVLNLPDYILQSLNSGSSDINLDAFEITK